MATKKNIARFDLAVIAAIALIAGIVFLAVEAQSERMAVSLAIRNMRSGLQWAMAQRLMRSEEDKIAELVGANPLDFLGPVGAEIPNARWQFDAKRRELIYRPAIQAAFGGMGELRWRIDGVPAANARVTGLRLVEVPPAWAGG